MNRTLALALALVVGCAVGATATHVVSPAAEAETPAQTWKYRCEADVERDRLEVLGDNGWEMVGLTAVGNFGKIKYCFKRPS